MNFKMCILKFHYCISIQAIRIRTTTTLHDTVSRINVSAKNLAFERTCLNPFVVASKLECSFSVSLIIQQLFFQFLGFVFQIVYVTLKLHARSLDFVIFTDQTYPAEI